LFSRGPSIVLRKNCVRRNGGGSYLSTASSDKEKGVSLNLQDLSHSHFCLPKTRFSVSSHSKFDQIPKSVSILFIANTYKTLPALP